MRKGGPTREWAVNNPIPDKFVPPAVATARLDTGWSVSVDRGVGSGDSAEPDQRDREATINSGASSSSSFGPEVTLSCQVETLERRRRDAPWVSSAARETKRVRPTLANAVSISSSDELMAVAKENYQKLMYASGTRAAKDSHISLWAELCKRRSLPAMPMSPLSIEEVGSVMRSAGYRSALSYISDVKLEHIRRGYAWSDALDLAMRDAKRALTRGLGGASKSEEMRLEWLASLPDTARDDDRLPRGGALAWAFGTHFILREVELASTVISDLSFDWLAKHVTLVVPVSETDTRAAGCRRTLACCKPASREECEGLMCPFCVAVRAVRSQCELTGVAASTDVAQEVPLFGQQGDPFSVVEKEMVIEAAKQDAAWLVEAVPEASVMNPAQITGHFMRRSGCKRLAREGVPREAIKHLARHSSSAVDGYIEEAAEEAPGTHLWAQDQISTTRQLEDLRQEQAQIKRKLAAQEQRTWRERDIRTCGDRPVEGQDLRSKLV